MKSTELYSTFGEAVNDPAYARMLNETYYVFSGDESEDSDEKWNSISTAISDSVYSAAESAKSPADFEHKLKTSALGLIATKGDVELFDSPYMDWVLEKSAVETVFSDELPNDGESEPVYTNVLLRSLFEDIKVDPGSSAKDLMSGGLDLIQSRIIRGGRMNVGPENYATLAHYVDLFTQDKGLVTSEVSENIAEFVPQWESGLVSTLKNDKLNVIELGNIYKTLRYFGEELSDDFYGELFTSTVHSLDDFTELTNATFYRGLAGMPESRLHDGWLTTFQIAQQKQPVYEKVRDYTQSMAALSSFSAARVPTQTYEQIFEKAYAIEHINDVDDLLTLTHQYVNIRNNIGDTRTRPELTREAHKRARNHLRKAVLIARRGVDFDSAEGKELVQKLRSAKSRIEGNL